MEDFIGGITDFDTAADTQSRVNSDRDEISQAEFFELLSAELKYQDPTDPSDQAFLDKLTSLRTLEVAEETNDTLAGFNQNASFSEAANVIGKIVTTPSGSGLASAVTRDAEGEIIVNVLEDLNEATPTSTIGKEVKMLYYDEELEQEVIKEGTVNNVVYQDNETYLELTTGANDFLLVPFSGLLQVSSSVPFDDITKIEEYVEPEVVEE